MSYGAGTGASIGRTLVSASLGTQTATGAVRVWDPARLASITSIAVSWPSSNITGEQCEQLQLIATFNGSSADTEDCANSAIWSLIGPGSIDANGLFTSAPMNGYVTITGSLGRGIQRPVSGEIGVWGSGGTCAP